MAILWSNSEFLRELHDRQGAGSSCVLGAEGSCLVPRYPDGELG
jgi:hypothetical protein